MVDVPKGHLPVERIESIGCINKSLLLSPGTQIHGAWHVQLPSTQPNVLHILGEALPWMSSLMAVTIALPMINLDWLHPRIFVQGNEVARHKKDVCWGLCRGADPSGGGS